MKRRAFLAALPCAALIPKLAPAFDLERAKRDVIYFLDWNQFVVPQQARILTEQGLLNCLDQIGFAAKSKATFPTHAGQARRYLRDIGCER